MLRDEIAKYTELSGNDGEHTPIGIIGAYLDGYDKGLELSALKGFDGMTNGEVIQALFPNSKFTKIGYGNIEFAVDGFVFGLTDRWLNAPYKVDMRGET